MKLFVFLVFVITIFIFPIFSEDLSLSEKKENFQMTAYLDADNPIILEYEVEFWREKEGDVLNGKNFPISKSVKPGRVVLSVPENYQYFRVRAIARLNIRGFWSEFNQIKRYPLSKESPKQVFVPKPILKPDVFLNVSNSKNENLNYLTQPNVKLQSADNTEVRYVHYRFSGELWKKEKVPSLEILEDGFYELEYKAEDALGNLEKTNYLSFYVDRTPPQTNVLFESETYRAGGILYLSPNLKIKFEVQENGSGLEYSLYRNYCASETPGDWMRYETPLSYSFLTERSCKNEVHLEFYSVDKVGNKEPVTTLTFRIP